MAKEYIEREAAINFVKNHTPNIEGETTMECVEESLRVAPAADVAKVRRGRWVWVVEPYDDIYGVGEEFGYQCSECRVWAGEYGVDDDIYEEPPTLLHYCPNCGVKMDFNRKVKYEYTEDNGTGA